MPGCVVMNRKKCSKPMAECLQRKSCDLPTTNLVRGDPHKIRSSHGNLICRLLQIKICSIFPPSRSFSNLFFYFFLSLIDFRLDFFGLFSPPFKFSFIFVSPFFLCTLLAACEVWIALYVQSSHDLSS